MSIPFAFSGLTFHYGIALLQNIDFISWWSPAYAFLLADPAAWAHVDPDAVTLTSSVAASLQLAPVRTICALSYVALHLTAVVLLRFFPSVEILPFSSFPMFGAPKNLFDAGQRKHFWLSDKPHATGTLKNYAYPFCRPQTVLPEELPLLPYKYLLLSHGGHQPNVLHTNVEVTLNGEADSQDTGSDSAPGTSNLRAVLTRIITLSNQKSSTFASDASAAPALLKALEDAKAAFAVTPRTPVEKTVKDHNESAQKGDKLKRN